MIIRKMKFIVDHNVGKLVKWLRMLGYDTEFFTGEDDWQMVINALSEGRVILTRDTGIMKLGVIDTGKVKAVFINSESPEEQIRQVNETLTLDFNEGLFSRCMECNHLLEQRTVVEVKDRVPPYVYKTQEEYMECPACNRIYWKGTHWQAMIDKLQKHARM
ncbi:MAG: Mut7-C RNAse domain-containing protein [Dehalococcoidales bacterium]|nr:MAG: Mut7-C RNAse domain-containing protein [Dehalococcoidales bacterium]